MYPPTCFQMIKSNESKYLNFTNPKLKMRKWKQLAKLILKIYT